MNLIMKDDEYDLKENFELNVNLIHVWNYYKNLEEILDKKILEKEEEINLEFH